MTEKNLRKAHAKTQRVLINMNTGTRIHTDKKHPTRNKIKKDLRKTLDKMNY